MARRPTSSKGAPDGPSTASSGGGSPKDRNRPGGVKADTTKRAAATTGEEDTEDNEQTGGENTGERVSDEAVQESASEKKEGKPEAYVVLTDKAIIDDGRGGDFKVINAVDPVKDRTVKLTPERAEKFQRHGVQVVSEAVYKKQQEEAAAAA